MSEIPKIKVVNLQKSYKTKKKKIVVPLSKCDLQVRPNEFFVILGESGCGKSTLLRVIAGLEPFDFGEIYIDGIDSKEIPQINKNMSFVSQNIALFPHKTIYENIIISLTLNRFSKEEKLKRINELSELFDLKMLLTRKPKELSGGQQQRVAVARSMAKKPDICLFDEPLASLDPIFHQNLINMFKDVQKKTLATFLYCTHNQQEAFKLADRIGILHNRKFEQIGTVAELTNNPKTEHVAEYLNSIFLFLVEVTYDNGELFCETLNTSIKVNFKTNILNKFKNKKLKLAVRKDELILNDGDVDFEVVNITPNIVTIKINEKEISIAFDNEISEKINKIKGKFVISRPTLFCDGVSIF